VTVMHDTLRPVEDQVIVFRLLPRKDAAATFEYLTLEQRKRCSRRWRRRTSPRC